MARGSDPPGVQEAKGNPGKRKTAVEKREKEQARIATLLAKAPADEAGVPVFMQRFKLYAGARAVWKLMAPRLHETFRLQGTHRLLFAIFCCNMADWIRLNELIAKEGETQKIKTVSGSFRWYERPEKKARQEALDNVLKLSAKFGFTPADEYSLFKDQALAAQSSPGLFDRDHSPGENGDQSDAGETDEAMSIIGSLKAMDTDPPPNAIN